MRFSIIITIAVFASGCASTQTASLERRLRALEDENFQLRQAQIDGDTTAEQADEEPTTVSVEQADEEPALSERPLRDTPDFSRTPAPLPVAGPPQHWARAYRTPNVPGCSSGPYVVQFRNRSEDLYFEVYLDGVRLRVFGGRGALPHIPPGTSAYACLDGLGEHSVMGTAYHRRGSSLVEDSRFSVDFNFQRRSSSSRQHQIVRLDQMVR